MKKKAEMTPIKHLEIPSIGKIIIDEESLEISLEILTREFFSRFKAQLKELPQKYLIFIKTAIEQKRVEINKNDAGFLFAFFSGLQDYLLPKTSFQFDGKTHFVEKDSSYINQTFLHFPNMHQSDLHPFEKADTIADTPIKRKETLISTKFNEIQTISPNHPFLGKIVQIVKVNTENEFITAIIEDSENNRELCFLYGQLYQIFTKIQSRLPIEITIIKGDHKTSANNSYLEIHQAIIESNNFINANSIGAHEFCSMSTYLREYINIKGSANENQLWGNILHDFLSLVYENKNIQSHVDDLNFLETFMKTCAIKAIYNSWSLCFVLGFSPEALMKEFEDNFLLNELEFYQEEIEKYQKEFHQFQFLCEKMIYSKFLGMQGRIDRYIRNIPFTRFRVYETKTGKTSTFSQDQAFFQGFSYVKMLEEQFGGQGECIYIEYPRNPVSERLIQRELEPEQLLHLIKTRNDVWYTQNGFFPEMGPYLGCSQCFSKESCEFYCYINHSEKCKNHDSKCAIYNHFKDNSVESNTFQRMKSYRKWFTYFLDAEYFQNLGIINETHIDPEIRMRQGNCLSDIPLLNLEIVNNSIQNLSFKTPKEMIETTRLRVGDYVLITPQSEIPLVSESMSGTIIKMGSGNTSVKLTKNISPKSSFLAHDTFRIDLAASNYMVKLQKGALDSFLRYSFSNTKNNLSHLRDLILFVEKPSLERKKDFNEEMFQEFNKSQIKAIEIAYRTKDLALIQGPPGTGKTTIIAEIVQVLLKKIQEKYNNNTISKFEFKDTKFYKDNKGVFLPIKPILITAYTNKALDNIIQKIIHKFPKIQITRLGKPTSVKNSEILPYCLESQTRAEIILPNKERDEFIIPEAVSKVLQNADVIAATSTTTGNKILQNMHFEYVILDEAGQMLEPSALIALMKANHYILVGDHQQLPPIATLEIIEDQIRFNEPQFEKLGFNPKLGMKTSIFERLASRFHTEKNFVLLKYQYRMNHLISDLVSELFYDSNLKPAFSEKKDFSTETLHHFFKANQIKKLDYNNNYLQFLEPEEPVCFIDTQNTRSYDSKSGIQLIELDSRYNEFESELVANIVTTFFSSIIDQNPTQELVKILFQNIGIISGYRAQNQQIISKIHQAFKKIQKKQIIATEIQEVLDNFEDFLIVDTVDRFQGDEREIIIYSFVDSNTSQEVSSLNLELRRLNVAISRAKKKIILIGNSKTLAQATNTDSSESIKFKKKISILIDYVRNVHGYHQI